MLLPRPNRNQLLLPLGQGRGLRLPHRSLLAFWGASVGSWRWVVPTGRGGQDGAGSQARHLTL